MGSGVHLYSPTPVGNSYQNKVLTFLGGFALYISSQVFTLDTNICDITQVLKSQLFVDTFSESVQYTFLDYLAGGCELNFMVAIDFTGN